MTTKTNGGEAYTAAGTTVNATTSASSGDALTPILSGASTIVTTNTVGELISGAYSFKLFGPSGSTCNLLMPTPTSSAATGSLFTKQRIPNLGVAYAVQHMTDSTAAPVAKWVVLANGTAQLSAKGSALYTTPSALTFGQVYQFDLAFTKGTTTTDGKIKGAIYTADGSGFAGGMTAVVEYTTANTGTADIVRYQAGKLDSAAVDATIIIDDYWATDTYVLRGPVTSSVPAGTELRVASVSGAWTGAASALNDESDTTYAESPNVSSTESILRFAYLASDVRADGQVKLRLCTDTGTANVNVRAYVGAGSTTAIDSWTHALTSAWTDYTHTLTSAALSAINAATDGWKHIEIEVGAKT